MAITSTGRYELNRGHRAKYLGCHWLDLHPTGSSEAGSSRFTPARQSASIATDQPGNDLLRDRSRSRLAAQCRSI